MSSNSIITPNAPRLQIGVSACLLGQLVRYDGGHKRQPYICETLAELFELLPVCPEQEAGLGVPRPPVRLQEMADGIHAIGVDDQRLDVTQPLHEFATQRIEHYGQISGFILKARSPSCGLGNTPLVKHDGSQTLVNGLFADVLQARWPNLPIVNEEQLQTAVQQQAFIDRVVAYDRDKVKA